VADGNAEQLALGRDNGKQNNIAGSLNDIKQEKTTDI